jgi:NADH-quinone oxidoreductase subunit L
MNRVGDFGFLCGLIILFYLTRSVDFATTFILVPLYKNIQVSLYCFNFNFLDIICFFLFIGSMGKSAQIGLHT